MSDFECETIHSWDDFATSVRELASSRWLYRGQTDDYPLMTAIERALVRWKTPLANATSIEFQTIREFRRRLGQPEYDRVQGDTLHCVALMQHHGAPTRLLDCTYSPFVAAAFAMENGTSPITGTIYPRPVVWCFNGKWCEDAAKRNLPNDKLKLIDQRNDDARRNDETFIPLFQIKSRCVTGEPQWKFVKNENPLHLNERLTAQQGAFLCPADLSSSFEDNLKAMDGWDSKD